MNKIRVLSDELVNQIAAGEVVERPASVVKELVENSIDSGATIIFIKTEGAGIDLIEVSDNGCGMSADDALLALERHATSKLRHRNELNKILTMGFRGEALPSIAAVARMKLVTSLPETLGGHRIDIAGGKINSVKEVGAPTGTLIEVRNLFFNMPARLKFLKSKATELSHINQAVTKLALAYPSIHFKLTHQNKVIFDLPPQLHFRDRIASLFGTEMARQLLRVDYQEGLLHLEGLISPPALQRAGRDYQFTFVNRRAIQNKTIAQAANMAYRQLLPNKRYPICFLFLKIPPDIVDVNVHPAKLEVRFKNQNQIYQLIENGLKKTLHAATLAPSQKLGDFPRTNDYTTGEQSSYQERIKDAVNKYQASIQYQEDKAEKVHKTSQNVKSSRVSEDIPSDYKVEERDISFLLQDEVEKKIPETLYDQDGKDSFWNGLAVIGQLHNTYLLCQNKDEFIIVDQHAAHERATYERLVKKLNKREQLDSQRLLFPLQIQLNPRQQPLIEDQIPFFENLGFEMAMFGDNTLIVQAAPSFLASGEVSSYVEDILDELVSFGRFPETEKIQERLLERLACHSSIRANQSLPLEEMQSLLQQMGDLESPFTCPHGRPTAIRFTIGELAKRFKRS